MWSLILKFSQRYSKLVDTSTGLGYSPVEPSYLVATPWSGRTLAGNLLSYNGSGTRDCTQLRLYTVYVRR